MSAKKTCRRCGEAHSTSHFYESKREKDGLSPVCISCRPKRARVRQSRRTRTEDGREAVLCSCCKKWLPSKDFSITAKGYYSSRCKECNKATGAKWLRQRIEHVLANVLDHSGESPLLSHPAYAQDRKRLARYIVTAHNNYRASKRGNRHRRDATRHRRKERHAFRAVSLEDYAAFVASRSTSCECCGTLFGSITMAECVVDHCHKTGALRGLVCQDCNRGIGLFRDDIDVLIRAKAYLEAHGGTRNVSSL